MGRVYETALKITASISKAFKGDTYNAAKALTGLAAAAKKLESAQKSAAAFSKLESVVAKSKAKYDTAAAALRALEDAEKAAGGATKDSTKWRIAGERAVAKAAKEFDRATSAAARNGKALREMGVDTSRLVSEQGRLARALDATKRKEESLARYEAARTRLLGERRTPTPLIEKAGGQIRGIAHDAIFLGTAAIGAGAAMGALVIKTMKSADEIGGTAEKLGVGAERLQELRYGAAQSHAEVGSLDRALSKMAITIGKFKMAKGKGGAGAGVGAIPGLEMLANLAATGGGSSFNPFQKIGLDVKKLVGLKPEEQLKKIADGLATLKTHAERAAAEQAIFGKGATDIIPFLEKGSAGIDRLSKDAHKYGGVLSDEAIKNAHVADMAMRDAEMAFGGVTNTLGAALLPTVTNVFREFSGWVASNRTQIKEWAENSAKWIETKGIPAFKHVVVEVRSVAGSVIHLVQGAAQLVGGFDRLAKIALAVRLAPLGWTLLRISGQGFKAADALWKYTAAAKAANAEGGLAGVDAGKLSGPGKVLGLAATAQMVIGAAAVGYAIGSYLDEKFGISDWLAGNHPLTEKNGKIEHTSSFLETVAGGATNTKIDAANAEIGGHQAKLAQVKQLMAKGFTYEQASGVVFRGMPAILPRSSKPVSPGASASAAPKYDLSNLTLNLVDSSPEKIKAQLHELADVLAGKVINKVDERSKNQRRVGLGE